MTFSVDVVSTSYKADWLLKHADMSDLCEICLRLVTDPAEIMDCAEMAEALAQVSGEVRLESHVRSAA